MSKLQRFQASAAEIFIYGSVAVFVWQFSDWIVNRRVDCSTAANLPVSCFTTGYNFVGNPNYHFNGWLFFGALLVLVVGIDRRLRLGSPFSDKTTRSTYGFVIKLVGMFVGIVTAGWLIIGVAVAISTALTPGSVATATMGYLVLIGWGVLVAIFCYTTRNSLAVDWNTVSPEEQYRYTSDEKLDEIIRKSINGLADLIRDNASDPSDDKEAKMLHDKLTIERAILEHFRRESEAEQIYEDLRLKNDWFFRYYRGLKDFGITSAVVSSKK